MDKSAWVGMRQASTAMSVASARLATSGELSPKPGARPAPITPQRDRLPYSSKPSPNRSVPIVM